MNLLLWKLKRQINNFSKFSAKKFAGCFFQESFNCLNILKENQFTITIMTENKTTKMVREATKTITESAKMLQKIILSAHKLLAVRSALFYV